MKFDIVTIFPEMVEAGLAEGVIGRARAQRAAGHRRAQPARLHDRSAPSGRRRAVWRRAGDGDEAGAAVCARSTRFASTRGAGASGAAHVAGGPARSRRPTRGGSRRSSTSSCCAGATKASTIASGEHAGDRGSVDRRLRAVGRRTAGAGHRRCGRPAGAGRRRRRAVGGSGFVHARAARLSALHAAGGVPRAAGARRAGVRTSRRDSAVAPARGAAAHGRAAAGAAGDGGAGRATNRRCLRELDARRATRVPRRKGASDHGRHRSSWKRDS